MTRASTSLWRMLTAAAILFASVGCQHDEIDRNKVQPTAKIPKLLPWHLPRVYAPGLADNSVRAIHEDTRGRFWFATSNGVSRLDPKSNQWQSFSTNDGLADNSVRAIHEDTRGRFWFATSNGVSCISLVDPAVSPHDSTASFGGSVVTIRKDFPPVRLSVGEKNIALSHIFGLTFLTNSVKKPKILAVLPDLPSGAVYTSLAPHPDGRTWVGTQFNGLVLVGPDNQPEYLTTSDKFNTGLHLPAMTINTIVPVPGTHGTDVWVATHGGAALVSTKATKTPSVLRVADYQLGIPTGPVDAMAVKSEKHIFLGFNASSPFLLDDSELAKRRVNASVWQVSQNKSQQLEALKINTEGLELGSRINALAIGKLKQKQGDKEVLGDALYIGTSSGLFSVPLPLTKNTTPTRVTANGRLAQIPVHHLAAEPDGTLWIATEPQGESPLSITGYEPETDELIILSEAEGVPRGKKVEQLLLTDSGDLVVVVGNKIAKGRVFVPPAPTQPTDWRTIAIAVIAGLILLTLFIVYFSVFRHPQVLALRRNPPHFMTLPLDSLPGVLKRLNRARALQEVWEQLQLPLTRQQRIGLLTGTSDITHNRLLLLASLLTAETGHKPEPCADGVWSLGVQLSAPEPLRKNPTTLLALDWQRTSSREPTALTHALETALEKNKQPTELPYVLVVQGKADASQIKALLPPRHDTLMLNDDALRDLLFAPNPLHRFAGMLHTGGHLALSPYSIAGEVKESRMFFGRERLIREIVNAAMPRHLIVGPRRVGKSSLLRQLEQTIRTKRPNLEVFYLDLLGVDSSKRALKKLKQTLGDKNTAAGSIPQLLESRFRGAEKPGLLLIDEVDGLIEADAREGYPVFTALRTLQAEGVCAYVLTGYRYLYRNALNQDSPLYNFATMAFLGALEESEAVALASEPMARLGIAYDSDDIPQSIARSTGGYPSIVQLLCHRVLKELKDGRLRITAAHLEAATRNNEMREELQTIFDMNVTHPAAKVLVYRLVTEKAFNVKTAHELLQSHARETVSIDTVKNHLKDLIIFGFLTESDGQYSWTIPILRDLIAAADPYIVEQHEKELSELN